MADVLCACGDPGPAAAVAPVALALNERGHRVHVLSSTAATPAFEDVGMTPTTVPDPFSTGAVERRRAADVVLAGSSWGERSELPLIASAHHGGHAKSLVVLDYWSHYAERFTLADGPMLFPDRVAVMDERARQGLLRAGCPDNRIAVTGAPHFDHLLRKAQRARATAAHVRSAVGAAADDSFVLFVSQPIERQVGRGFGYIESEVLHSTIEALDRIAAANGDRIVVGVRRHALEGAAALPPDRAHLSIQLMPAELDKIACLMAADLIVGMNSVMLIEAAVLGRNVVSLQPGLRGPDSLWTNETGATTPVYDQRLIYAALEAALNQPPDKNPTGLGTIADGGAAARIADEVEALISEEIEHAQTGD